MSFSMLSSEDLKLDLKQFIGTTAYHKLSIYNVYATDGVAYFCDNAECYWLFDEMSDFITRKTNEVFVVADINCYNTQNGHCATIKFTDGNYNELGGKVIDWTDLPVGEWKFFISNYPEQKIIMLPSEY
jgi:hypothetical protein